MLELEVFFCKIILMLLEGFLILQYGMAFLLFIYYDFGFKIGGFHT